MSKRKAAKDWTAEHVKDFWNWYGSNPYLQDTYFTAMDGIGIINFLKDTGKLNGNVLDYGCGTGHLLAHLLDAGVDCYGIDLSTKSVEKVNSKFAGHQNWKGALAVPHTVTPFNDNLFNVIICVETLEHLPDDAINAMLVEFKRIIRPGGIVMITTPFAENLEKSMTYCPFCDSEFHKMQHIRSFTIEDLKILLVSKGFEIVFCRNMDFEQFQTSLCILPLRQLSLVKLYSWAALKKGKLLDALFHRPFPDSRDMQHKLSTGHGRHLCALVTK